MAVALSVFSSVLVGAILVYFPWSPWWEANYLLPSHPLFRQLLLSPYLRGAVSGLGLVNVALAAYEAWLHLGGREDEAAR